MPDVYKEKHEETIVCQKRNNFYGQFKDMFVFVKKKRKKKEKKERKEKKTKWKKVSITKSDKKLTQFCHTFSVWQGTQTVEFR